MKKRILIIYASYGSGHKTVANYIYNYFKKENKYDLYLMNIMDYANVLGKTTENLFDFNIKYKCNVIFTMLYELFNNQVTTISYKQVFKKLFKEENLKSDLQEINPDLIIATHFFGITLGALYNKEKLINSKIISVMTDYCSHNLWEKDKDKVSLYVVANENVKNALIKKGIPKKKILSYGIPISEKFVNNQSQEIKKEYGINNNHKTVVFFAGGSLGSNGAYKYFKNLINKNLEINIIFVCGKNKELKQKIKSYLKLRHHKNIKVIGFSNEVHKLLSLADIIITKPGGISITECLQMKKPMILIPGNGGQEVFNAKYICESGFGIYIKRPTKIGLSVSKVLEEKLTLLNKNLQNCQENHSLEYLYKNVLELL